MNEAPSDFLIDPLESEDAQKQLIIALAKELFERKEHFPFPGIDPESYSKIKADQDEFPGYSTPIDELMERFQHEGIKVVLGAHPESGNVFILPAESNDIENDSIFPRHLQLSDTMDVALKNLIMMNKRG